MPRTGSDRERNFLVAVWNEGDSTPDHINVLLGWRRNK